MARQVKLLVVKKRFGDEWLDVREFVRPNDYMVGRVIESRNDWTIEGLWSWVLDNIQYPSGSELTLDRHTLYAFHPGIMGLGAARRYTTIDYWEFPSEVLRDGMADCEGSAALLVSMLRKVFPSVRSYVTVGYFEDHGHVWASILRDGNWLVLDTTLDHIPSVMPVEAGSKYVPIFRFNEQEVLAESEELVIPERVNNPEKSRIIQSWYMIVEGRGVKHG